jgi:hypothetical protein
MKVGYWPCYCVREVRPTRAIDEMLASSIVRVLLWDTGRLLRGTRPVYDYGQGVGEREKQK